MRRRSSRVRRSIGALALALFGCSLFGCALLGCGGSSAAVPAAGAAEGVLVDPSVPIDLSGLAFLRGSWRGEHDGGTVEEHWTDGQGGSMLGMNRIVKSGRTRSFEFMVIGRNPEGGVSLLARPQGGDATAFALVSVEGEQATFQNEAHDYPKRIVYWRSEDGALHYRTQGTDADPVQEARMSPAE